MAKFKMAQVVYDLIYPVGSIYIAMNGTNPGTLFGGTWTRLSGGFLYATSGTPNKTVQGSGGTTTGSWSGTSGSWSGTSGSWSGTSGNTTLSVNQIPKHVHNMYYNTIGGMGMASGNTIAATGTAGIDKAGNSAGGTWYIYSTAVGNGESHNHSLPSHTHSIPSHTHSIPSHFHSLSRFDVAIWYRTA